MTVGELTKYCYDKIVIYTSVENKDNPNDCFKDLYKGEKNKIPNNLLDKPVQCFGARRVDVIEICI